MTAVHTTLHPEHHIAPAGAPTRDSFDWSGQIRLGIVLTVAVVIVAVGLGGLVPEPIVVLGSMVIASVLAWRRVDAHAVAPERREAHLTRR
jgi:hypothetical protein